tara:strand:+ start:953 stop:1120 length:168 start_codon:yes stop_codon:yes gene_type:complete
MATKYSIGDKVKHKLFGEGHIVDIDGFEDSAKLTIEFKGKVSRMIVSKYVRPVKK